MAAGSTTMMKTFMCLIRDDKIDEFADLLDELKHELVTKAKMKVILSYKWVEKLPVYCTLCDRYNMLNQIHTKLMETYKFQCHASFGLEVHVIDLAKALNYHECEQELLKLYIHGPHENHHACIDHGPQDYQLFEGILKVSKNIVIEFYPIIDALCQLCKNGYNIRALGPNGSTPLHAAFVHSASFDIIRTIVSLGGDMNVLDKFGCSPFSLCIRKNIYRKNRDLMIKLVKLWLYQNPDLGLHKHLLPDIVSCDRTFRNNPNVVCETRTSDEDLYLLPLLYNGGFPITPDDIGCGSTTRGHGTYMLSLNTPRDLKQLARLRIRHTYPGLMLHVTIKQASLPVSIRDYILLENLNVM